HSDGREEEDRHQRHRELEEDRDTADNVRPDEHRAPTEAVDERLRGKDTQRAAQRAHYSKEANKAGVVAERRKIEGIEHEDRAGTNRPNRVGNEVEPGVAPEHAEVREVASHLSEAQEEYGRWRRCRPPAHPRPPGV